jgi:16S rRNA (adenine1518-N6/adenine1519-N6)-dimethyltransferase
MTDRKTPYAKKFFGQNFLVDQNFVRKIVDAVGPAENDTIVEIGPGRGALTEHLIKRAGRVIAIEVDRDMAGLLKERFAGLDNFELITADALTVDYEELRRLAGQELKLVANLPYYISTAILQHLIQHRQAFSTMVLMFQREVVERIMAEPGSTDRGYLTVLVQAFLDCRRLFDVPPDAFRPQPKVSSSVVVFTPRSIEPAWLAEQFKLVVSAGFRQKRKTLQNNFRSSAANLGLDPKRIADILRECNIDPTRRAETLTQFEWVRLALKLS